MMNSRIWTMKGPLFVKETPNQVDDLVQEATIAGRRFFTVTDLHNRAHPDTRIMLGNVTHWSLYENGK